jgi:integrase
MARPRKLKPAYCHDRASDRAYVRLDGKKKRYLGDHGTQASRDEYDRLVGEWIAAGRQAVPTDKVQSPSLSVSTIIAAFWSHALGYYSSCVRPNGRVTGELDNYRLALKPLRRLYGDKPAVEFGPLALKSLRNEMIRLGWCRNVINRQILRIKHVFKWAVENEMLDAKVYEALRAVAGLREGKTDARETSPVKPVAESHAKAIFQHLSPQVQAMTELQSITGMRPGELCIMRGVDIDATGKTWRYRPSKHKTQHHKHERIIDLGPRAREIIERFLKADTQAFLFSPADAAQARRQLRHVKRSTPLSCGNVPAAEEEVDRDREPGERYTPASYRRAIARACASAFPPPAKLMRIRVPASGRKKRATRWETAAEWRKRLGAEAWREMITWERKHRFHPHQLRHTAATRWRKEFGAEATLVLLGDRTARMLDIYAEQDRAKGAEIMEKIG